MLLQRLKTEIHRHNLRPQLIKDMQEKEASGTLNAETDIVAYYFYKATQQKPLSLIPQGLQFTSTIFESPFRGKTQVETDINIAYANACALYLIKNDQIPFGSHIKYTGPLKDVDSHERTIGIVFGKIEEIHIPTVITFVDRGLSFGMLKGLELHRYLQKNILFKNLDTWQGECTSSLTKELLIINKFKQTSLEIIQQIDDIIGVKTIN